MKNKLGIVIILATIAGAQNWVYSQGFVRTAEPVGATATTQAAAAKSEMAVKEGLGVVVQAAKKEFTPDEPLVLKITYANVSNAPIRLLDVGGQLNFLRLGLEDTATGKKFTGDTTVLAGPDPVFRGIKPVLLKPGESVKTKLIIRQVSFMEGDLDFVQFQAAMQQARQRGPGPGPRGGEGRSGPPPNRPPLPEGTYKLSMEIYFVRSPHFVSVPADLVAAKAALEADPLPPWKADPLLSKPFELTITRHAQPPGLSDEDRQNAKDVLSLIKGWREMYADFLPAHNGMSINLDRLEVAATAAAADDGTNASTSAKLADFSSKLTGALLQARFVSQSASETEASKKTAAEMNEKLLEIWNR